MLKSVIRQREINYLDVLSVQAIQIQRQTSNILAQSTRSVDDTQQLSKVRIITYLLVRRCDDSFVHLNNFLNESLLNRRIIDTCRFQLFDK